MESRDGLHVRDDHFYPENIDPASGEVLPDGETGELVLTSLTKEACPVIRCRTRNLTRLMPGTARSMRRMQKVTGRSDDMLIIRGANLRPTQVAEILLRDDRLSPHDCLEVRREGRLDELAVLVEARAGAADEETRAAAGRDVARHVKSRIGISCEARVMEPESIERPIGFAHHDERTTRAGLDVYAERFEDLAGVTEDVHHVGDRRALIAADGGCRNVCEAEHCG